MTGVPAPLADLGKVFIPIPPGEKGTDRERTEETLFEGDDPILDAYLEAGHNYGIAARGDLAIVDEDEPDALADLVDRLPETPWQVSGSRSSNHRFLLVPGLENDIPLDDPETGENLGHIKAAPQSYVVGPGSRHPSGNYYGPLRGPDELATIDEDDLRDLLEPWTTDDDEPDHGHGTGRCTHGDRDRDADVGVYDVLSRRRYPEGKRCEHPFHGSSTGSNFMVSEDGETFRCWRHGATGNGLHLLGMELGVISCGDWVPGGLSTDTWREVFDTARERGYADQLPDPIESIEPEDVEHHAILPNALRHHAVTDGWDWTSDGYRGEDALTIEAARDRTTDAITNAIEGCDDVLIEALPTMGKTYGEVAATAAAGEPTTILTCRGNNEQYEKLEEWCADHGLTAKRLPSFFDKCDTANGEYGDDWVDAVERWYDRGATGQDIHKHHAGDLPCQNQPHECPYTSAWRFDPDDYDILIGHYSHAYVPRVTAGRTVLIDEFPGDDYETTLDLGLERAVSRFLETTPALPFDDYTDLLEGRADDDRRVEALDWFDGDADRDPLQAFDDGGHAAAPIAVYALLTGDDLGNGWERALLGNGFDGHVATFDRARGAIHLLEPPAFEAARNVIGLDGTPTVTMWRLALGRSRLNHRQVLTDDERVEYIRDVLGLHLVRTTDAVKGYAAGEAEIANRVTLDDDRALLEGIAAEHGQQPALITTKRAKEHVYEPEGVLDLVTETKHYGDVLGSNEYASTRLGAVIGSRNYGPDFVAKWGAYHGTAVEPRFPGEDLPLEAGVRTDYGDVGNEIRQHMTEHQTLQAAMRFGRDGNGAVVYVHTNTLPDWVPIAGEGRVLRTRSQGEREVVAALNALPGTAWTTAEVAAHPDVNITRQQVFTHLERLYDRGYLDREQNPQDGRGYRWLDDDLHRVTEHGEVELEPVELDDLDEVRQVVRMSTYTWNLTNSPSEGAPGACQSPGVRSLPGRAGREGGDPPDSPAD
ncbi:bifunctional DNA primase/polymerase [Natronosalvus caseinilyticus]|uniref:bifunctional DNA primase/polymerase n=1 Tax=Natronosalvus caseinilyticus TaxID=2953747 RepID=UPI0028AA4EB5|nr:bifunctional DNA primase/polymerase [Natronosalvus caseinilyticus]